jgi:hypothetical protein
MLVASCLFGTAIRERRSSSNEQNNQDDQENGAKPATDIRATNVKTAATEHKHQDDDKDYEVHVARPSGMLWEMSCCGVAIAIAQRQVIRSSSAEEWRSSW